jgi:phytoene synthase
MTNIARDVIDDAKGGRVYLPRASWRRPACRRTASPIQITGPRVEATRRLLEAAEPYYDSA